MKNNNAWSLFNFVYSLNHQFLENLIELSSISILVAVISVALSFWQKPSLNTRKALLDLREHEQKEKFQKEIAKERILLISILVSFISVAMICC